MFGHSMNLLEFGGRVEGLDRLLEDLMGPDGYFKKGAQKREKRSVSSNNQLEKLHKKVKNVSVQNLLLGLIAALQNST